MDRRALETKAGQERAQGMDNKRARAIAMQAKLSQTSVVEFARFVNCKHQGDRRRAIQLRLSAISPHTQSKRHYTQSLLLQEGEDFDVRNVVECAMEAAPEEIKLSTTCPKSIWTCHFREVTVNKAPKRLIEVLHCDTGMYVELDVTNVNHEFLGGDEWGEPAWLGNEEILVYTAKRHPPHWQEEDKPYSVYEYEPHFGEQLSDVTQLGLFVLDFRQDAVVAQVEIYYALSPDVPKGMVFKQPTAMPRMSPSDPIVIFATGCSLLPDGRRPGSIWCDNQPYAIFRLLLSSEITGQVLEATGVRISPLSRSARFPRMTTCNGTPALIYTSYKRGLEHNSCASLHKVGFTPTAGLRAAEDIIVDVVQKPSHPGGFPGLYPDYLPTSCFLKAQASEGDLERAYIVLPSLWGSRTTILTVDLLDGSVVDHGTDEITSFRLLATDGRTLLLAVKSSIISPPELVLGVMGVGKGPTSKPNIGWQTIKSWLPNWDLSKKSSLDSQSFELFTTIVRLPSMDCTEAIVVSRRPFGNLLPTQNKVYHNRVVGPGQDVESSIPPLVCAPHGGPNKQDSSFWNIKNSLSWLAAGFTVALINYPGSAGFGQATISDLSKDCGILDVQACLEMKRYLVKLGIASPAKGKSFFLGHSHSGFIGAHLSVRYPDDFDAISLCNPVIDLVSNFATSDIPAWSKTQFGLPYDFGAPPTYLSDEEYKYLRERSANHYAAQRFKQVQGPCLPPTQLLIGSNDLRVPPNQGINWYHCLKGHGQKVTMLVFPDNGHGLETIWASKKALQAQLDFVLEFSSFA